MARSPKNRCNPRSTIGSSSIPSPAPIDVGPMDDAIADCVDQMGALCALINAESARQVAEIESEMADVELLCKGMLDEVLFDVDTTLSIVYGRIDAALNNAIRDLSYDLYWLSPDDMVEFFPDGPPPPPVDVSGPRKARSKSGSDRTQTVAVDSAPSVHGPQTYPGGNDRGEPAVQVHLDQNGQSVNVFVECGDTSAFSPELSGTTADSPLDAHGLDRPGIAIPSARSTGPTGSPTSASPAIAPTSFVSLPVPPSSLSPDSDDRGIPLSDSTPLPPGELLPVEDAELERVLRDALQARKPIVQAQEQAELQPSAPPAPDPVYQSIDAGDFRDIAPGRLQSGDCEGLTVLRDSYVAMGASALDDMRRSQGPSSMTYDRTFAVARMVAYEGDDLATAFDHFRRSITFSEKIGSTLLKQVGIVEGVDPGKYERAAALKAAVQWLEMLDTFAVDFSRQFMGGDRNTQQAEAKGGTGTGVLKLVGIKGDAEYSTGKQRWDDTTRTINMGSRVKLCVVAMLETAKWLSDRANGIELPSINDALLAHLRGNLSRGAYECLVRVNGGNPLNWQPVLDAARTQLSPFDYVALYRRGKIDAETLWRKLRGAGMYREDEARGIVELSEAIPPITDLVRFMVRDVEDEAVVNRYALDSEFDAKWRGPLREWGRANGFADDTALRYWRAHWDYPSNTQLFEMFHRLQPDLLAPDQQHIAVTLDDVKTVLAVNDTLPFWRERLAAISYHPLTRTDAQRMRMTGVLDRAGLIRAFREVGYAPAQAEHLADFTERRRMDFLERYKGSRLYAQGTLSRDELRRQLARFRVSDDELQELFSRLDAEMRSRTMKACIASIKKDYMLGGMDRNDLLERLQKQGVPLEQRVLLAESFQCQKASRKKEVPAQTLCKWFAQNLLSEEEYRLRLIRLGYSSTDTVRLVAFCKGTEVRRLVQREQRNEEQKARDTTRAKKVLEQAELKARAAEARTRRTRDKEAAAEAKRKGKLRKAALTLAGRFAGTAEEGARMLQDAAAYLMAEWELSQTEAEALAMEAVGQWDGTSLEGWRSILADLARQDAEFDLAPDDASSPAGPIR